MNLDKTSTWFGTHKGIRFSLQQHGVERADNHPPLNNGFGCWCFYLHLHERTLLNFNDFWLQGELKEFSPGGTRYLSFPYETSALSDAPWNGGITFWEQTEKPYRSIKVGCDFSHLWDSERNYDYDLTDIHNRAIQCIEHLLPLFQLAPK